MDHEFAEDQIIIPEADSTNGKYVLCEPWLFDEAHAKQYVSTLEGRD